MTNEPERIFETEGGRHYLATLLRLHPTPLTLEAVARALEDDGSRFTLAEVAAQLGVDLGGQ